MLVLGSYHKRRALYNAKLRKQLGSSSLPRFEPTSTGFDARDSTPVEIGSEIFPSLFRRLFRKKTKTEGVRRNQRMRFLATWGHRWKSVGGARRCVVMRRRRREPASLRQTVAFRSACWDDLRQWKEMKVIGCCWFQDPIWPERTWDTNFCGING